MNLSRIKLIVILTVTVMLVGFPYYSFAAQTVHLRLQIDGDDIEGESTVASMDREGTIECLSFQCEIKVPIDITTGRPTRKRQYEPIIIVKRIDRSTPLLLKALCQNEPVTQAEFRFYRPNRFGTGTEEHFYTVILENAHIIDIQQTSEDAIIGGGYVPPMLEEISFQFRKITWTYEDSGATYTDDRRNE